MLDDPQQLRGHLRRDRHCPVILAHVLALGDAREAGLVRDERGPSRAVSHNPSGQCFTIRSVSASLTRFRVLRDATRCEAVTELVQHLSNGDDGIVVVVTDLAVD